MEVRDTARTCDLSVRVVVIFLLLQPFAAKSFNLTILHSNDIHGRFDETDKYGLTCKSKEDECFGGIARMATVVKDFKRQARNVILVDGADRFSGTIWTEVYRGNATATFINELNYTAITLGNHDFDYGVATIVSSLQKTNCPVVVSNMNTSLETLWPDDLQLVQNTVIVNIDKERIGFVGYIIPATTRLTDSGEYIKFLPIIQSVRKAVRELQLKGINKIIAVGHAGFNIDKQVAKKVSGIDVVVGGHSNTFLYSGNPSSDDKPVGPYPFIVHPEHNKTLSVPVVQAYYYTKYLGNLEVEFDDNGIITSWHGNPILLNSAVSKDKHVGDIVKRLKGLIDKRGDEIIGKSKVKLDATDCGNKPCNLGRLMTLAMVYHFRSHNATISLLSAGGVKNSLPIDAEGNVRYKDLFNSFPYRNTIDLVQLSGADLKQSLEFSGFLQVQGLKVKYSDGNPKLVEHLEVKKADCKMDNCYSVINMNKMYKIVSDSYMITTGNHVIARKGTNRIRGQAVYDVLVEYFKENSPITFKDDVHSSALKLEHCCVSFLCILFVLLALF